ncbi:MAG: hypothetical protein ABJB66_04370 [Gemmatimonadaceae bacterium]
MTNRRYSDDEAAAIFAKAIETESVSSLPPQREEGLSLAELQEIGREVGLTPDALARAAQLVESGSPAASRTLMGFPIAVERTVMLNRRLTDAEWELLVVKLREAFDARGRVSAYGSFRQWTNGNLQALLEPTSSGHRLRLSTIKASAYVRIRIGAFFAIASGVLVLSSALTGGLSAIAPMAALLLTVGTVLFAGGLLPLRNWARTRRRQMELIAEDLVQG